MNTEIPNCFLLLKRRILRLTCICKILFLFFCIMCLLPTIINQFSFPALPFSIFALLSFIFALPSFMLGVVFLVAIRHAGVRYFGAYKVCTQTEIVYWIHPTKALIDVSDGAVSGTMEDSNLFVLHLRDGTQLELSIPSEDVGSFVIWLKKHNPSVRVGNYEDKI